MANTKLRNPQIVTDRPSCESLKQQSLAPTDQLSLNSHKSLSDTIQWCQHDLGVMITLILYYAESQLQEWAGWRGRPEFPFPLKAMFSDRGQYLPASHRHLSTLKAETA